MKLGRYKFVWSKGNPFSNSTIVSREDLLSAIQSDPLTSIDNMISYNRWMKDTWYMGDQLQVI